MEKKVSNTNEKLLRKDKPGYHRALGHQEGLTEKEKEEAAKKAKIKKNKK